MSTDVLLFVSAGAQFASALWGAIVSLPHNDWPQHHRKIVLGVFVALGSAGMWATLVQARRSSAETAAANTRLANRLNNLDASTKEISRVQGLNTKLQERLLASNVTITDLSKTGINTSTGGSSFCYVKFLLSGSRASLIVLQRGEFPLADVAVSIFDSDNFQPSIQRTYTPVGTLPVKGFRAIGEISLPPSAVEKRFVAAFTARNGVWDQLILLKRNNGPWKFATRLQTNPGQVTFANLNRHRRILLSLTDSGFPGEIADDVWDKFNGVGIYCIDCRPAGVPQ